MHGHIHFFSPFDGKYHQPRSQCIERFSTSISTRVDYPGTEDHFGGHISLETESRGLAESSRGTPNRKLGINLKSDGY